MEKIDILNRDKFIKKLMKLIENISENKSSTCFAINGVWGSGKTFVLDMLQERLEQIQLDGTSTERFFVIRYNCWKFDYYEEPLVAIVASLISIIEEKTKLFPDGEDKREIIGMLKAVGVTLLSIGNTALHEKTGINVQEIFEKILDGKEKGAISYQNEHNYDAYFSFNKVMHKLAELIKKLAEKHTIVFMVDELDRCLPEYAIKVLERLHHLTEEQANIITVIAIDRDQLQSSIHQIFGFQNPEKYLEKFISFEVKLDYGTVSKTISEKYADYLKLFDKDIVSFTEPIEECLQAIFKNIDIRSQEQLVKKAMLTHKLLYNESKDYSFMCMELLVVVMICIYRDESCFSSTSVNMTSFDSVFMRSRGSIRPAFTDFFKEKFEKICFEHRVGFSGDAITWILPDKVNLYGAILYTWYWMHERSSQIIIKYYENGAYEPISKNYQELKRFAEMIRMMY